MKFPSSYSNQRVGIFVDVQNLYHSAKNLYHGRVNYTELMKHLVGERQLIRAMAYVVKSEGVEPQHGAHVSARPPIRAPRRIVVSGVDGIDEDGDINGGANGNG